MYVTQTFFVSNHVRAYFYVNTYAAWAVAQRTPPVRRQGSLTGTARYLSFLVRRSVEHHGFVKQAYGELAPNIAIEIGESMGKW